MSRPLVKKTARNAGLSQSLVMLYTGLALFTTRALHIRVLKAFEPGTDGAPILVFAKSGEALILRMASTRLHSDTENTETKAFRFSLNQLIVLPLSSELIFESSISIRSWQLMR